ncbi:transcription factor HHO3-like [Henckelia pumila]|uniref:transcription factor HHO3-like n=1 Tax=Henckelia pumila TaxID=405737 RepID=UPI003C6E4670
MLISIPNHSDFPEKIQRCQDYIQALEEERLKIQVFRRELPLCLDLVTQAIETCKQQLSGTTTEYNLRGQSECSEQTSRPVFEEFIPLKRASFHPYGEEEEEESRGELIKDGDDFQTEKNGNENNSKKSDWLRYVQLWNETPDPSSKEDSPRKVAVVELVNTNSGSSDGGGGAAAGAFHPFKKDKSSGIDGGGATTAKTDPKSTGSVPPASTSSTADTGGGSGGVSKKEEKGGESQRKSRRCWSPELHRRFEHALQQLGGSHVATPKQIRELMKVDGLTNDEVKSHLQKYRLHMRRPGPTIQNNHPQAPQFVVVGGIWVPPEYAAAVATAATSGDATTTTNGIYAPIASVPQPFRGTSTHSPKQSEGGEQVPHSPATSSTFV